MSVYLEFDFRIPYKRGDKLIVFKKTGKTELKRKFRRILEFDRLEKLSFKRIKKFSVKEVYCCCDPDIVEFTDGSIEWTSSVAKPGELKKKLSYHIDKVEKKERKTKKNDKAKIALLYPKSNKEGSFINLYNEIMRIIRFPFHYLRN